MFLSKIKLHLCRTKQKYEFIAGVLTCKAGKLKAVGAISSDLLIDRVRWDKCESDLTFSANWLPGDLLPYLNLGSWVGGTRKFTHGMNRLGVW